MQYVFFDKKRAGELLEALRAQKPVTLGALDLLPMAAVCLSALQWTEGWRLKYPTGDKHLEHAELEVEQGVRDWLAALLFVQTLVGYLHDGVYDTHCEKTVAARVELTQEPRFIAQIVTGAEPGYPWVDKPDA